MSSIARNTEKIIPRDSIPKPPPEEWHERAGGWERNGTRVEPHDGVWVVRDSIDGDDPWGYPFGDYATAEEAMQAADDGTYEDGAYEDDFWEDGTSHETWQDLNR
jgi:hypothetical protein